MSDDVFRPEPGQPAEQKVRRTVMGSFEEILAKAEDDALEVEESVESQDDRVRTDVEPRIPNPTTINLFQHPEAHPFVLDLACMRAYGPEWMHWEPEVLEARVTQDFNTRTLSQLNFDKLQAVKCLHLVDTFWNTWTVFSPCVQALSGVPPDFRVMQTLTVPQLMIAVDIARKLREDVPYGLEVRTFMEVACLHDGIACPPAPLEDILDPDLSDFDIDCANIRARWDEVRVSGKPPTFGSTEDVQLARMLEAHQILEDSRKQLQEQLPLLYNA